MQDSPYCHLDVETEHELLEAISTRCAADWLTDVHKFAPRLVHLLCETRDGPMKRLEPTVREILREQSQAQGFNADSDAIDQHVTIVLESMEQVRRDRIRRGDWSTAPVPPQMFG